MRDREVADRPLATCKSPEQYLLAAVGRDSDITECLVMTHSVNSCCRYQSLAFHHKIPRPSLWRPKWIGVVL